MRIGIDGSCLANRRGFGRFARQTLDALTKAGSPHEFVVLVDAPSFGSVTVPSDCETVVVPVREAPSAAASSEGRRRVADLWAMGKAAASARLDLLFFPASYSFFPVWNVPRVVVTMHDTLAFAHAPLVFPRWQGRLAWTVKEHAAARWADRILTVSEASRRDLIAWFRLPPDRVGVVTEGPDAAFRPLPPGPDSDAALARYGVAPGVRFFLYVGGLSPHKNLPRLIEAFGRSRPAGTKLVLVGDLGDVFHTHVPELRAAVDTQGLADLVVFTGFVPDVDLAYFYNRALALVQPSLAEGFGLPAVEAMSCGTPVVSSSAGSLPEVIGDAGLYFEPTDVAALASLLTRVAEDGGLRDRLAREASRRASRYSWTASARGLLDTFEALGPGATATAGRRGA